MSDWMTPAICRVCNVRKDVELFAKNRTKRNGREKICKQCDALRGREPERRRRRKEWERTSEKRKAWNRNRDRENRKTPKFLAGLKVRHAVECGRLTKPETCQKCERKTPKHKLHGHHEDYSKPLDVIWVCSPCHRAIHGQVAIYEAQNTTAASRDEAR